MEESIRLSAEVFARAWRRLQAAVERKVDSWFVEDERELQARLDGGIRNQRVREVRRLDDLYGVFPGRDGFNSGRAGFDGSRASMEPLESG